MSKEVYIHKNIPLKNSEGGSITISKIVEPYGKGSKPIASIGIDLDGDFDNPQWKAHIPFENLDEVIEALQTMER